LKLYSDILIFDTVFILKEEMILKLYSDIPYSIRY
jgi:hypothetical protein